MQCNGGNAIALSLQSTMVNVMEKNIMEKRKKQKGVTLLEMAAIIGIVLILAMMGVAEWNSMDDKAVRNASLVSAKAIGDGLRMYQIDRNNQGYTCSIDKLVDYVNLTALKNSFTSVQIDANAADCNNAGYVRISGTVKGIQPDYIVYYYVDPAQDSQCSRDRTTLYLCKDKF